MNIIDEEFLLSQARRALGILVQNQKVTRQDCFRNEGPKKFKEHQKQFLNRLVAAGVIVKFESPAPNHPSYYQVKDAAALLKINNSDYQLGLMALGTAPTPRSAPDTKSWPMVGPPPVVPDVIPDHAVAPRTRKLRKPLSQVAPSPAPEVSVPAPIVPEVAPSTAAPIEQQPFVVPPEPEATTMKDLDAAMVRLLTLDQAMAELLVWMKESMIKNETRFSDMEKKVNALYDMWRDR